ncbi:hypothetical protein CSAL01_08066 [Colletotrichum salicis]|uniref:Uncharacterized protein n=1 Tax=Colletotrichum salicis TaxID=1209931 RepID=A0A135UNA1_9PEZI|nr:hypothetical protein CSAL01_08066 [Colletotrichum salicis]
MLNRATNQYSHLKHRAHGGTRHGAPHRNSRIITTSASPTAPERMGTAPHRYRRDSNGTTAAAAAQLIDPASRLLHGKAAAAAGDSGAWHGSQSRGARLRLSGWAEECGREELCAEAVKRKAKVVNNFWFVFLASE